MPRVLRPYVKCEIPASAVAVELIPAAVVVTPTIKVQVTCGCVSSGGSSSRRT